MYAAALEVELFIGDVHSLKAKRGVIKPIIEGARRRHHVASSEVGRQDSWQRATLGFAAVSGSARSLDEILDAVERFVWSFPEVQVLEVRRLDLLDD